MIGEVRKESKSELDGYAEGKGGPGQHQCKGEIHDAAISGSRIILVCYTCNTFWFTGSLEMDYLARSSMLLMAETFYALPATQRVSLLRRLHEVNVRQMYKDYRRGLSLDQVGNLYGLNGTTVREKFIAAGVKPRHPGHPIQRPVITWHGMVYTYCSKGYYRKTTDSRSLLHVDVWEHHHGPVPEGYKVCRLDHNLHNNQLKNLVCLPATEAAKLERQKLKKVPPLKRCLACNEIMPRRNPNGGTRGTGVREGYAAYMKRRTCSKQCSAVLKKGQPRGFRFSQLEEQAAD